MERILTEDQATLLRDERRELGALQTALARLSATREDLETLTQSIEQLDQLFLLVVIGEFNSGKSTFINALLGERLLEEGVTPTTQRVHVLTWGESAARSQLESGIEVLSAPIELLRQVRIVDTPGTNALDRDHEAITRDYAPRADLVLFVTSADRPFTESERAFIEQIRQWGKKLVFVINKIDILRSDEDRDTVVAFVRDNARKLLSVEPEIFSLSASRALSAKLDEDGHEMLTTSGFGALERYVAETLDSGERLRLKLLNPLGVGDKLAETYVAAMREREALLDADRAALEEIGRQLALYAEDKQREFEFRLTDVDNVLHEFEKRGDEYFEETLRITRIPDLLNKSKLEESFARKVIANAPQEIEQRVEEIIDWMIQGEVRLWQSVTEHLESRRSHHAGRLLGSFAAFDYDRKQLLDTVGRAARRSVDSYDRDTEARELAGSVQTAIAGTALLEVGAIGLGATVTLLATTQLADVTGILAASTMAILGLFVIPARRRKAKKELAAKIHSLRTDLMQALRDTFVQELERSTRRIEEAISPYTRFVRAEAERLAEHRADLDRAKTALEALRARVEAL